MEYINGSEALKILKELELNGKISKIIYISVTAFEDQETKNRIKNAGFIEILSKPVNKNSLNEIIESYLKI